MIIVVPGRLFIMADLKEKYLQFKNEEGVFSHITSKRRINRICFLINAAFVVFMPTVIIGLFLTALFAGLSITNEAAKQLVSYCLVSFFGGIAVVVLIPWLYWAYFGNNRYDLKYEVRKRVVIHVEDSEKLKQIRQKAFERKEFFKFYELIQDEDFRIAYFKTLYPDAELVNKFKDMAKG